MSNDDPLLKYKNGIMKMTSNSTQKYFGNYYQNKEEYASPNQISPQDLQKRKEKHVISQFMNQIKRDYETGDQWNKRDMSFIKSLQKSDIYKKTKKSFGREKIEIDDKKLLKVIDKKMAEDENFNVFIGQRKCGHCAYELESLNRLSAGLNYLPKTEESLMNDIKEEWDNLHWTEKSKYKSRQSFIDTRYEEMKPNLHLIRELRVPTEEDMKKYPEMIIHPSEAKGMQVLDFYSDNPFEKKVVEKLANIYKVEGFPTFIKKDCKINPNNPYDRGSCSDAGAKRDPELRVFIDNNKKKSVNIKNPDNINNNKEDIIKKEQDIEVKKIVEKGKNKKGRINIGKKKK